MLTCYCQHDDSYVRTSLKEGLLQRQRNFLQLTTQWRIRVKHFPNTNYANLSQQQVEKTIDAQIKETAQLLKERMDDGQEDMLRSLVARERDRLRKTYAVITQGYEHEAFLTIEGHQTFWVVYGVQEVIPQEEGIKAVGYKEVFLPGSYILQSGHVFFASLNDKNSHQRLTRVPVENVMPEATSALFILSGSPMLWRIFLLGETSFYWLPEEFIRVEQQNSLYQLRSRYWYYDRYRVKERWLTERKSTDTPIQRQIAQMDLSVKFLIDPSKRFAISHFEDLMGQLTFEVTRWKQYGTLWIPAEIVIKQFAFDVSGGQRVQRDGVPILIGAKVSKRQTAQITIELISVDRTRERRKLKDLLSPDLVLTDYRLGLVPPRAVSYVFEGALPNLNALERMYKEQQQWRPPTQARGSPFVWQWIPPAILVILGIVWYIRGRIRGG